MRAAARRAAFALLCGAGALGLAACATEDRFEPPPVAAGGPKVPYETVFEGVEDDTLRDLLERSSKAVELEDRPPATAILLRHRGEGDVERLRTVLRSEGYYEAEVAVAVDMAAKPARLVFRIDPGSPYRLATVDLRLAEGVREAPQLPSAADIGLERGERARAAEIVEAGERLLRRLQRQGYPYPKIAERRVVVDRRSQTVDVAFQVDPGRAARFGPTTITGLEGVDEHHVRRMIPWQEGAPFDIRRFAELRGALLGSGLFATVQIRGAEQVGADGVLPVTVALTERKRRTITAGLSYQSEQGPGAEASWEHRNLFGGGESLRLGVAVSAITQAAEASFRKPLFLRRDQALLSELRIAHEEPDAFTSDSAETQVLIERTLRPGLIAAAGLGFKYARIDDEDEEDGDDTDEFGLVFLPTRLRWDTSDDPLDPTKGGRLATELAPFQDVLGNGVTFLRGRTSYSRYLRLSEAPRVVLAGRGAIGSIVGAERDDIPADERFYAGGGGSVRGYAFQTAGELEDDGDPIGGRSLLELSGELRVQATETLGFVTFLDAGRAFSAVLPDFDEELLLGAGVGLRYFTAIGPLRLDVAVPVNPRDEDDSFQVYVSLGQAF